MGKKMAEKTQGGREIMQPFTLLIKPSGSDCNIDCEYCFYKDRPPEFGRGKQRMSDQVLDKLVEDHMRLGFSVAGFAWQGGEPTLMGVDFFRKAVELLLRKLQTILRLLPAEIHANRRGDSRRFADKTHPRGREDQAAHREIAARRVDEEKSLE